MAFMSKCVITLLLAAVTTGHVWPSGAEAESQLLNMTSYGSSDNSTTPHSSNGTAGLIINSFGNSSFIRTRRTLGDFLTPIFGDGIIYSNNVNASSGNETVANRTMSHILNGTMFQTNQTTNSTAHRTLRSVLNAIFNATNWLPSNSDASVANYSHSSLDMANDTQLSNSSNLPTFHNQSAAHRPALIRLSRSLVAHSKLSGNSHGKKPANHTTTSTTTTTTASSSDNVTMTDEPSTETPSTSTDASNTTTGSPMPMRPQYPYQYTYPARQPGYGNPSNAGAPAPAIGSYSAPYSRSGRAAGNEKTVEDAQHQSGNGLLTGKVPDEMANLMQMPFFNMTMNERFDRVKAFGDGVVSLGDSIQLLTERIRNVTNLLYNSQLLSTLQSLQSLQTRLAPLTGV